MIKLDSLKQQVHLYIKKVEGLMEVEDDTLRKEKNEYKVYVLETLDQVVIELKKKVVGKSTSTATAEAMNDITILQLTGVITYKQLKTYVDKYKEYPMILNYLKQIGMQNGYHLSFKNASDAVKIIESLEINTKKLLENYDPSNLSHSHKVMLEDVFGYYEEVEQELNDFFGGMEVHITKI